MKLLNKLLFFLFVGINAVLHAEMPPAPAPTGGGGGGVGPGEPASPVDMYVYVLIFAAVSLILLFQRKIQKNAA